MRGPPQHILLAFAEEYHHILAPKMLPSCIAYSIPANTDTVFLVTSLCHDVMLYDITELLSFGILASCYGSLNDSIFCVRADVFENKTVKSISFV